MYLCSKCHKSITEPLVSMCDNKYWHSTCLTCQVCGLMGGESLYSHCGLLVCKDDYAKMNSSCKTCQRPFASTDMIIHAKNFGYMHDKCVFCNRCRNKLETGDRYMITVNQGIVCHKCVTLSSPNQMANGMPPNVYMMTGGGAPSPAAGSLMPSNGYPNGALNGHHHHHLNHHGGMHMPNPSPLPPPPPTSTPSRRGRKRGGASGGAG